MFETKLEIENLEILELGIIPYGGPLLAFCVLLNLRVPQPRRQRRLCLFGRALGHTHGPGRGHAFPHL